MGDFEEKNQESENLITDVSSEETSNEITTMTST